MAEETWKEVRSKLEGLGLKLKLHLDQERDETDTTTTPGATKAAVEDLGNRVQDAFASFGTAAKDPAIHTDMKEIGALVKDAMMEAFSSVGAEVTDRFGKTDGGDPDASDSGTSASEAGEERTDDTDPGTESVNGDSDPDTTS